MFKPAPKKHADFHEEPLPPNVTLNVKMPEYPSVPKREIVILWSYRAAIFLMLGWICIKPVLDRVLH